MKFNHKRSYARSFGTILADALPYLPEDTIVVPVPTARARIRRRGFDQAVLIARSIAKSRNLQMEQVIIRVSQEDQIGKRRSERMKQMEGSFRVIKGKQNLIKEKSILLIDDVITTGATIEAAAALLRKNGAKHIDAAVIARHLLG
jgi:ComF family protein